MKIVKYLFFLLLIAIIAVSIYVAVQPADYEVKRSRLIEAPVSVVYNNINDYKNWESWGPWQEQDPTMTYNYAANTVGVGGSYTWNGKDGKGKMETVSADANKSIDQKLSFEDFEPSDVYWAFNETDKGTEVTWGMKGTKNFMFKLYTTFAGSMEKTVGPMYERGLEKLDSVIVDGMKKYSVNVNGVVDHGGGFYIYNTVSCKTSEIPEKIREMMGQIGEYAIQNKVTMAGAPFVYYREIDNENNAVILSCCIPTTEKVITNSDSGIVTGELPSFAALKTTLTGNYSNLKAAWETAQQYMKDNKLESVEGPMLEVYTNDPGQHPNPADWTTEIYLPVKSN
ncbi:transcription activator effector-binding protein [Leptobacterium flavescens]|uniref:Transcription activator effector-binding protein n=1 Tax=Leptobacterium flavescens TaxID=472055 RepID=A0A6P0UYB8_9FLAO|nr:GyrI-like domain-containing protein [Leptobacterium flavescens]NER15446.1 transcription activator effector-binding protein [Leptobacterium flavescens]